MKPLTAIVIGGGSRGQQYSEYASVCPEKLQVVGVADPRHFVREKFRRKHDLSESQLYNTWEEVAAKEKLADCVFICTQDQMHKEPAVAFANKGYHILLEKPMAVTFADCAEIVATCRKNKVYLAVCHVLRYSPQARVIKHIIQSGAIGDVMNIQHVEPVGFWHFAHSFVRGNWRNEATSSFSLLAKCCHDIDLIEYWMGDKKCERVSSMGSLKHFKPENKPDGAGTRCMECSCEQSCAYSAKKIYLRLTRMGLTGWPMQAFCDVVDIENVTEAIKSGPYGRCVYDCDNDVMDNQVVLMQYEGGATCSMSMVACSEKLCERQVRIFGTKGELSCDFGTSTVREFNFLQQTAVEHNVYKALDESSNPAHMSGHGGADFFTVRSFVDAVLTNDESKILTGPEESLRSHFLCFEAERARLEKSVVDV